MICNLFSEPAYFFFTPDLPGLLYYSHIPTAIIALFVGVFVFMNDRKQTLNQLLFFISACFSLWILSNLILWTNIHSDFMLFVWSFLRILSSLISILCVYFVYVFLEKKDVSLWLKGLFLLLLAPVIILAPTHLNLSGFNITSCDAFMFEGVLFQFYRVAFGILAMLWILVLLIRKYRRSAADFRKQIVLMGVGIEFFLFSFFIITFLAAYLTDAGVLSDSRLEFYGLFGMSVFMIFIGILMVRFKAFHVNLIATQALVFALVMLIGSEFAFIKVQINMILTAITLLLTFVSGYFLIGSVKREIQLREEVEQLAKNLDTANEKLKELDKLKSQFLSIASHDLRAPLTIIRNFISLLLDGTYGTLSAAGQEGLQQVFDRATDMAKSVDTYLNVSRIEQGRMKYDFIEIELLPLVRNAVTAFTPNAEKKGLAFNATYDPALEGAKAKIDVAKMNEILNNLLDNTIKYTPTGSVDVSLRRMGQTARFTVKDTGVGMSPETIGKLFQLFSTADNSRKVNVTSTGVGLYISKTHVEAHGGKIWAESEGEGKGSTFIMELPLL